MPDSLLAVFADVHANLEALQAVLADMDVCSVDRRVCLGDVVGYAADPAQCLQLVRSLECPIIKGNHDAAAAGDSDLDNMRNEARIGIEFARGKLSAGERSYLAGLPFTLSRAPIEFVHASLSAPEEWPYILRESDARENFEAQNQRLCFCGHTHIPMVCHLGATGNIKAWRGLGRIKLLPGGKTLVNAGSVGQPRDLCPAACYVLYNADAEWVEFRRVKYDIAKTRRKILRAKLPRSTADRLRDGQ